MHNIRGCLCDAGKPPSHERQLKRFLSFAHLFIGGRMSFPVRSRVFLYCLREAEELPGVFLGRVLRPKEAGRPGSRLDGQRFPARVWASEYLFWSYASPASSGRAEPDVLPFLAWKPTLSARAELHPSFHAHLGVNQAQGEISVVGIFFLQGRKS